MLTNLAANFNLGGADCNMLKAVLTVPAFTALPLNRDAALLRFALN